MWVEERGLGLEWVWDSWEDWGGENGESIAVAVEDEEHEQL
jgi:hypothetical protein